MKTLKTLMAKGRKIERFGKNLTIIKGGQEVAQGKSLEVSGKRVMENLITGAIRLANAPVKGIRKLRIQKQTQGPLNEKVEEIAQIHDISMRKKEKEFTSEMEPIALRHLKKKEKS